MNKKFLTALLLGAFTIASTSTLVSCKDYDDDINGLQEQITSNDNDIAALQSSLQNAKTALETEVANLKNDLATEVGRAEKAEKELGESLSNAKADILAEVARAKAAEGDLSDLIGDELKRATAAETALEAKIKLANDAIDAINKALETKASKEELKAAVDDINAKLKALGDDLADAQNKLQKAIDDEAARAKKAEEDILGKLTDEQKAREDADKEEKDAREKAVAALQLQLDALDAFDKKIDARVKAIEDTYMKSEDIQKLVNAAKAELEGKIATAKAEVMTELATQVEALNTALKAQKTELEGKIEAAKTELNKAIKDEAEARDAADKKEAEARVKAIEELTEKLNQAIITFQNGILQLTNKLNSEVSRLEGLIEAAKTAADNAQIAANNAQLDATKAQEDLATEIERATAAEEELTTKLGLEEEARKALRTEMINKINTEKSALEASINQEIQDRATAVQKVSDKLDMLSDLFSSALRGLVLEPKLYYHGIQAIDASKFEYADVYGLQSPNPDGDNSGDKATYRATLTQIIPDLTATYHMNPSIAVVDTKKVEKYSFAVLNREYTRTVFLNKIQPKVYNVTAAGGKLTVKASVSQTEYLQNIAADDAVTVVALQYKQAGKSGAADTVITSDYAAIKAYKYNNVVLNNAQLTTTARPHVHLYVKANDAIRNYADDGITELAWDDAASKVVPINWDSKGINLMDIVNSHRDVINGASTSTDVAWDTKASDGKLKDYGLEYRFDLLGYHVGGNLTSESAHAVLVDGNILVPVAPKADGTWQKDVKTAEAAQALQNRGAELGREPLVRVQLYDTESKKIVQVGYIKFHITENAVTPPGPTPDTYKTINYDWADNYTVVCDPANSLSKTLTWNQIETDILGDINQSSSEFRANYTVDGPTVTPPTPQTFTQYNGNTAAATIATPIGTVTHEVETSPSGANTDVIKWVVTNAQAWAQFKVGNKTEIVTYVRFKKNGTWSGVGREDKYIAAPNYLVVKLTWKPGARNMSPETSFNTAKTPEYWHAAGAVEANTGFDNIWGNVEVPGTEVPVTGKSTATGDDEFIFDLKNGLIGNKFTVGTISGYTALDNNKTATVHFATPDVTEVQGVDGKTYVLTVSGTDVNPSVLYAHIKGQSSSTRKPVAYMITTGADQGVVSFNADNATNDYAKAILNYRGRKQQGPGETLTAKVQVVVKTCAPATDVKVNDNTFNLKFIRPVNAENGSVSMKDAVDGGDVQAVSVTWTDWRGLWGTTPYNYFEYYGVSALTVPGTSATDAAGIAYTRLDASKATTTMNGGSLGNTVAGIGTTNGGKPLSSVTNNLVFSYYAPATVGTAANRTIHGKTVRDNGYGVLVYENNGTPVADFQLRIPMTVTYEWGQFVTYIDVTVAKTIGVKKQ